MLGQFMVLGLTSFGGPVAHLGYFRERLVVRRRWISEQGYADLVALAQFVPGPASSQVGFALGVHRAGILGGLAAFAAFTLPSALLLLLAALGAPLLDGALAEGLIAGLKVVAVAVVAHAVWGMARALTPDVRRAAIAAVAGLVVLLIGTGWATLAAIALGAAAGMLLCRAGVSALTGRVSIPISRTVGAVCLAVFAALLIALPVLAALLPSQPLAVADAFYRAGALVFGGGHVVLPLLESAVVEPGWVSNEQFLAGYGAAQAVPGPLFTFAAYLGATIAPGAEGLLLAGIALVAIFVPGLLLIAGVLPFWGALQGRPSVQALVRGANAAVVGVLAATLYDPVMTSALVDAPTVALAVLCTVLLIVARLPAWVIVIIGAGGGMLLSAF
ncbi:MAG: chromate efflux transporter [Microcella sp.]|nr:chromate efflux transporter [Microcella sp.]